MKKIKVIVITFLSLLVFLVIAGNTIKLPYTSQVTYTEQEPYEETEEYTVIEAVSVSVEECVQESSNGICIKYETFYDTEYKDIIKERTVTKYREVEKQKEEKKYQTLFQKLGLSE